MPLSIELIASTTCTTREKDGEDFLFPRDFDVPYNVTDADALPEFAGRSCYESWTRPNPATGNNRGYMANILDHGHFSVLEHSSATLYVQGVSRALTHELVRHRHFSPSQLSQRFVDESNVSFVIPPAIREAYRDHPKFSTITSLVEQDAAIEAEWQDSEFFTVVREAYTDLVDGLSSTGLSRKEVREAARSVLPNCTETKIVLTGNLRCWREFFSKRRADGVDVEMREFADAALVVLQRVAPNSFQDFT